MRILSQDGKIDLPYENFSLSITQDNCIVAARDVVARPTEMLIGVVAKYSTEAKARKAMEMLHHMYTYGEEVELPEIDEKQFAEDDDIGLSNAIFYNKNRFFRVSKKYFQFPSDDEAEV